MIIHVVGARPNYMKLAPVYRACAARGLRQIVVHTGQHYGEHMSDVFFRELGLDPPEVNLGVGSGSHAQQTAGVMIGFERVVTERPPELVVVYGDVNSTLAASLVCAKQCVPLAHVEAGLRSHDPAMPEEVNRIVTDRLSDLLFAPSQDAVENLLREGAQPGAVHLVGNVMVDSLLRQLDGARAAAAALHTGPAYGLLTLHRPSNVDDSAALARFMAVAARISERIPLVFPVHPRTRRRLDAPEAGALPAGITLMEPLPYTQFLGLEQGARFVITDSGGVQEETTVMGVPCLTVRDTTERPVTVEQGTNTLVGLDFESLLPAVDAILDGRGKKGSIPPLWDGRAGERIAAVLQAGGFGRAG